MSVCDKKIMRRNSEPVFGISEQIRVPRRSNTLVHRLTKPLGVKNIRWELLAMPRLSEGKYSAIIVLILVQFV